MMDMRINGGTFKITDDNESVVSGNVAKEINDNYEKPDNKSADDGNKPKLTIKD